MNKRKAESLLNRLLKSNATLHTEIANVGALLSDAKDALLELAEARELQEETLELLKEELL